MIVRLPNDVVLTALSPNTDEAERRRLPGGGAKVKLSWAPEHMHLVRGSPGEEGQAGDGVEALQKLKQHEPTRERKT